MRWRLHRLAEGLIGLVLTSGFAGCGYARPPMASVEAAPVRLVAQPLPLSMDDARRERVGALVWAGGLRLTAPGVPSLGGLSGIDVADDGLTFLSQSDEGALLRGRLVLDARGRLVGVADATYRRLVDEAGRPYHRKIEADAEDVTLLPGGYAISFEQDHRVMRYADGGGPGVRLPVSPDIRRRPANSGLEALSWRDSRLYEGAEDGEIWRCRLRGPDACVSVMPTSPFPGYSLTGLDACGQGFAAVFRQVDVFEGWRAVIAYLEPAAADGSGPWRAQAGDTAPAAQPATTWRGSPAPPRPRDRASGSTSCRTTTSRASSAPSCWPSTGRRRRADARKARRSPGRPFEIASALRVGSEVRPGRGPSRAWP